MGRPRLYHTAEEKKAAEKAKKARYYEKYVFKSSDWRMTLT
jgi:hypothetical protein